MQNQCYTVSAPDASGATKYYRSHYNQWCGLHWMLRGVTNPQQKTAAAFCLWRTDTNFKWFFKSHFIASRQILAVAACCVQCRRGVTHLSRRNKASLASDGLQLLELSPVLESWFDIYTGPTSCLIIPQTFSAFVFNPFCHSWLFTERSLLHIMSRHAIYCWLATSLLWYFGPDSAF